MKLKCRTKVDDEKLVDDDKFIEDFIRQQFLKFYVYINKLAKSNNQPQQKKRGPPAAQNLDSSGNTIKSGSSQTNKAIEAFQTITKRSENTKSALLRFFDL